MTDDIEVPDDETTDIEDVPEPENDTVPDDDSEGEPPAGVAPDGGDAA